MKIISLNLNGIRSAAKKGFAEWVASQKADVVCVQELKAQDEDIVKELRKIGKLDSHFYHAKKKGYSGVGVYVRETPESVSRGFGVREFDHEGRYLRVDLSQKISIISLYVPSGSSGPERQASKFRFMKAFLPHLKKLRSEGREFIICGDINIAHQQIDLKNWRSNQKNSGFLPEEREWLTGVFDKVGFVDVFRKLNKKEEQYTWWSNRGQAWAKNVGWRIDYQLSTPEIGLTAKKESIFKTQRFSDHAPLVIEYDV